MLKPMNDGGNTAWKNEDTLCRKSSLANMPASMPEKFCFLLKTVPQNPLYFSYILRGQLSDCHVFSFWLVGHFECFWKIHHKTIEDATFAGFLIRFRPNTGELEPIFSKYYFRAEMLRKYFVKEMMIVTRASLGQNLLKNLPVLIPPREEQIAIGEFLDEKCAEIEAIIQDKQRQLEKVRSYKKSLIYEYVTGKKRVKEVQQDAHQS